MIVPISVFLLKFCESNSPVVCSSPLHVYGLPIHIGFVYIKDCVLHYKHTQQDQSLIALGYIHFPTNP